MECKHCAGACDCTSPEVCRLVHEDHELANASESATWGRLLEAVKP